MRYRCKSQYALAGPVDRLTRAVLRRYKLNPNQDVKILALGGGTNRVAAMKTGAVVRMVMKWARWISRWPREATTWWLRAGQIAVQPARKAFKSRWMKSKLSKNSTCHRIRRRPSNGVSCRSKTRLVRSVFL